MTQGGQHYYYLYDGKGNVTSIIDASQDVVAAYAYDAFGTLLSKTGSLDQPYQFSTKPYDDKTGLSYFGHRFYSPALGRWMTRDPMEEAVGLNLFGFVHNNPINYIDPTGYDRKKLTPTDYDEMKKIAEEAAKEVAEKTIKKKLDLTVPKPKDCKELERIYKDQKKTTEEAAKPWWKKLKDVWDRATSSTGGTEDTTPEPTPPLPPPPPPTQKLPPMKPPGQNDWSE
jgi:RHS repeat-associated protein